MNDTSLPVIEVKPRILRPTWAEINLSAIRSNLLSLGLIIPDECKILLVIKANAYGHGAQRIASFAQTEGLCDWFGVSSIEEGIALRDAGITLPILVLGSIFPFSGFREALRYNLSISMSSVEAANELKACAEEFGLTGRCHVKIDTGMGRIGVRRPAALKILKCLKESKRVVIEGIFTHLSSADSDHAYTKLQMKHFKDTLDDCAREGIDPGIKHIANSYAAVNYPESRWDMIRPGIAVYGMMEDFKPALSLKTRIVFLKDVRAGSSLSYGRSYRCKKQTRVATIPIGYADGLSRRLSNTGEVLIKGKRCRILGNISMDMAMVDVTHVPEAHVGDEVVVIGTQGAEEISARDIALWSGTIPYEVVTSISMRVPRVYM